MSGTLVGGPGATSENRLLFDSLAAKKLDAWQQMPESLVTHFALVTRVVWRGGPVGLLSLYDPPPAQRTIKRYFKLICAWSIAALRLLLLCPPIVQS